jgi:hypothetical protein
MVKKIRIADLDEPYDCGAKGRDKRPRAIFRVKILLDRNAHKLRGGGHVTDIIEPDRPQGMENGHRAGLFPELGVEYRRGECDPVLEP